jgi:hypothetical protein
MSHHDMLMQAQRVGRHYSQGCGVGTQKLRLRLRLQLRLHGPDYISNPFAITIWESGGWLVQRPVRFTPGKDAVAILQEAGNLV